MKNKHIGWARFWMVSSTVLLGIVVAAVTWLVSIGALYSCLNLEDDVNMWISCFITFVAFYFVISQRWSSIGSVKFNVLEILIGVAVFVFGFINLQAGFSSTGGQMFGGVIELLLGMYLGVIGLLLVISGSLGWLAIRLSRARKSS